MHTYDSQSKNQNVEIIQSSSTNPEASPLGSSTEVPRSISTSSETDIVTPSAGPVGTRVILKTKKYSYCAVQPPDGCMGDRNLSVSFNGNNTWASAEIYSSHIDSEGYKIFEIQVPLKLTRGMYRVGVSGAGKDAYFIGNPATFTIPGIKIPSITVIQPDGGTISYGSIVMAGDLLFQWKANDEKYKPSKLFKAYILDTESKII